MTDMKAVATGAIDTYGQDINNGVDQITEGLNALCSAITNVNYGGKNAFKFKTDTGTLANKLSTDLKAALDTLATNVAKATTDLSGAFGNQEPIVISLKDNTITPADPGEDTGDGVASVSSLESLSAQVEAAFETIKKGIAMVNSLPVNSPQGWMGIQRNNTQIAVDDFVPFATKSADGTKTSITDFITSQINAIRDQ